VELVCAGLRNNSYLTDGREFGRVIGEVDMHFLEGFNIVGQRTSLRIIDAIGERGSVDGPVVLVHAAAGKAGDAASVLPLQTR